MTFASANAAEEAVGTPASRFSLPGIDSLAWVKGAMVLILGLQFVEIFTRAINWDEFWHYNHIQQLAHGTLNRTLQSLHARLYGWVLDLPGNVIDHVIVIRTFMFAYELVIAAAIAAMARRFTDRSTGLLCALAYLSFPFVFQHGASFRYDPPSAALMMGTLWLLLCSRLDWRAIAVGALLVGLAPLVSIKTVLYAPAFLGVVWLRWTEHGRSREYLLRLAAMGLGSLGVFALAYWIHSHGIAAGSAADSGFVSGSGSRMFALEAKPYWGVALRAALVAPAHAVIIALLPARLFSSGRVAAEKIALGGLFLPLSTLIFYHNTAPYYYVFMLPPVLVACSVSIGWLRDRFKLAGVSALFLLTVAVTAIAEGPSPIDKQRQIEQAAADIFPDGTRYFDYPGFLGAFPKANPFMSIVVTRDYLDRGVPVMRNAMLAAPVPLVMEDDPAFTYVLTTREPMPMWLPADVAAVRSSYRHFWGPFWVAAQDIPAGNDERRFDLLVPGPYTIEGSAMVVDGKPHAAGDVVRLDRGAHVVAGSRIAAGRLLWGDHLRRPKNPPPAPPYFMSF